MQQANPYNNNRNQQGPSANVAGQGFAGGRHRAVQPAPPPRNLFDDDTLPRTTPAPTRAAAAVHPQSGRSGRGSPKERAQRNAPPRQRAAAPKSARRTPQQPTKRRSGGGGGRPPKGKKPASAAKYFWRNVLKVVAVLGCIGLIVLSIMAVQVAAYVVDSTQDDAETGVLNLEVVRNNITQASRLMVLNPDNPNAKEDDDYIEYQKLISGDGDSLWVSYEDIPQTIKDAVISTEDQEFWDHKGFSLKRTLFAAFNQVIPVRETFGASTLDQQLVKNLTGEKEVADDDGDHSVGYQRKMREIYRAYTMNKQYSKQQILEAYLNTMPLSGTLIGVRAGAREYFNKELDELTIAESATIAGITQAPGDYNPFVNPDACKERRDTVLFMMYDNGTITKEQMDEETAKPLELNRPSTPAGGDTGINSYFSDTVQKDVVRDLAAQRGWDEEYAERMYYNGGYRIYTTMDLRLQQEMEQQYEMGYGSQEEGYIFPDIYQEVEKVQEDGSVAVVEERTQSAMAVINYDGELKGVVGGIGEKDRSLSQNRAVDSVRHVGSTMKPVAAYSLGIDEGWIHYSSLIMDNYVVDTDYDGAPDWPRNATGGPSGNAMLASYALASSTNTVATNVGNRVGAENMFGFMRDTLGISSLIGPDDPRQDWMDFDPAETNDMNLSSLVLGGMTQGVSPYQLAGAYMMFGNGGRHTTLHSYDRVEDANGNIVVRPEVYTVQAISEDTSYIMNRMLSNVLRGPGGTAYGMGLEYMDSVGKTGTSTREDPVTGATVDNDRWFVGLTPYYVTAVWWGYDSNGALDWPTSPYTNPAPLMWNTVMENVQANLPEKNFFDGYIENGIPEGVLQHAYCTETGDLASAHCPSTGYGYYRNDGSVRVPPVCTLHNENTPAPTPAEGEPAT